MYIFTFCAPQSHHHTKTVQTMKEQYHPSEDNDNTYRVVYDTNKNVDVAF